MLVPKSGKNGFLLINGLEVPIYLWLISKSGNRITYRTAQTVNYPKRLAGLTSEQIQISGVQPNSPFASSFAIYNNIPSSSSSSPFEELFDFYLGWNDFAAGFRRAVNVNGLVVEDRIDINYFASNEPSHMWTSTLIGVIVPESLLNYGLTVVDDNVVCAVPKCDLIITTTDSQLNSGFVKHVRNASIISSIARVPYRTANSDNHYTVGFGLPDKLVDLVIQGDFDYWFNNVDGTDVAHDYKFYYGPTLLTDYWPANNMKILGMDNFIVNIRTNEMIQATVHLGASND